VLDIVCCGDLVLDEPQPDHWLGGLAATLRAAAVAIGHVEVPHTVHQEALSADVPAPGANPAHLAALARAGIDAVTLAGNHIADCGAVGISDTVAGLEQLHIAHCGAGQTLTAARAPAWIQRGALRLALLSYNCVGPEQAWATATSAGCAYVRITPEGGGPVIPSAALSRIDPESLALMQEDIRAARRAGARICIVALHKGIVHTPALLAPYERAVAHAAVDAGADVVLGHHAHILRGIETYRGRPIFHGLGNGCVVTRALSVDEADPKRAAWARRRQALFGFTPDPAYYLAPFHPQAIHGMLARVVLREGLIEAAGFIPLHFEPPGRPVIAGGAAAETVCRYVSHITEAAGLAPLRLSADPDMVRIL